MGVVLYRVGDTHVINGVTCEAKVFSPYEFKTRLNANEGWNLTPEAVYPPKSKIELINIEPELETEHEVELAPKPEPSKPKTKHKKRGRPAKCQKK